MSPLQAGIFLSKSRTNLETKDASAVENKEQKGKQFISVAQLGLEPRPSNFQETVPAGMPFSHSFSLIPSSNKCYGTPTVSQGMGTQPRAK